MWGTFSTTILEALEDDLNTVAAIAELHKAGDALKASANLLGLLQLSNTQWQALKQADLTIDKAEIERLIQERLAARAAKNWAESDRIRDELAAKGVALKDSKDGTTWEVKR